MPRGYLHWRESQSTACKRFKPQFRSMEDEYFASDFRIADETIQYAEDWNEFCDHGMEILVSRGMIKQSNSGIKYLVEPLIRYYTKWTSNTGWIDSSSDDGTLAMEAFSHFTYHASGRGLIVCDLQGRYRRDRNKSRFELTDPAICSTYRGYGPTDLGEKGIHSFFANHQCNHFCRDHWATPSYSKQWFQRTQGTCMISSRMTSSLCLQSRTTFRRGQNNMMQGFDSDSDDSW